MTARPAPQESPRVRMYRQGLGECFLVTLPGAAARPFHMLIDCGLRTGAPDEAEALGRVARDIEAATAGRLDVVVVSHDHWGRVSGFALAREEFDRIAIGEVWLGWAEDPTDPHARSVASRRERDLRGLQMLACRAARSSTHGKSRRAVAEELDVPLGFFGPRGGAVARRAVEYLKDHPSRPRVRYKRAGGPVVSLVGSAGASAYILGPSADQASSFVDSSASLALFASAGNSFAGDVEDVVQSDAFDDRYRVSPERAERQPFFRNRYLADAASWRRIDRDWMAAGTSLALGLDGRCRNLSLAIAIEVEQGGPILLFPGDAQAESWAAWAKLRWHAADRGERPVTGADLLARTILLKVGHHGAAGATPGPGGLDLMNSPELVAMLPVDEEFAENCGFRMPDPSLVERLLRTTRGRLLRSDRPFPERPEEAALGEWEAFRESVFVDPDDLYIDLLLRS